MRKTAFGALLACALVALAGQASAQSDSTYVEKETSEGQDIRFKDDPVGAIANDPIGSQLTAWHPPKRFDLMRPRWSFIPEMLKSVEHM